MPQKQCDECGETVDVAKAFCPSCGHAFVEEEKRTEASVFDSMEGTMQFGQTMYNQMLSDMGLNKDAKPKEAAKQPALQPAVKPAAVETLKPVARAPRQSVPPAQPETPKRSSKLLIFGIVAAFLVLLLVVAVITGVALWLRYS